MPYVITTKTRGRVVFRRDPEAMSRYGTSVEGRKRVQSRRAVATLDEVRKCHEPESWALGTDNPSISFPDGTVIEVEQVREVDLRDSFDQDSLAAQAATLAQVLNAYNAAQGEKTR